MHFLHEVVDFFLRIVAVFAVNDVAASNNERRNARLCQRVCQSFFSLFHLGARLEPHHGAYDPHRALTAAMESP